MKEPRNEMTNEHAKFVLGAYRPNGADAQDPIFAEALEQAKRDPNLAAWFAEQRAFDQVLTERLQQIEPGEALRSTILSGLRATPSRRRFPLISWLAAAAAVAVGGFVLLGRMLPGGSDSSLLGQFKPDAIATLSVSPAPKLDMLSADLQETRRYIDERHAPRIATLPAALQQVPTAGCRVFKWNGFPASLTCFEMPGGELVHLVVIDEKAFGSQPIPVGFQTVGQWQIMLQKSNGQVIMWASQVPMKEFKNLVVQT
jgi:hypothetical protein